MAVRDLARVTDPADGAAGLSFPGDDYVVLGLLARTVRDLGPALDHLQEWQRLRRRMLVERSGPPDRAELSDAVAVFADTLATAYQPREELAQALTAAQTVIRDLRQT